MKNYILVISLSISLFSFSTHPKRPNLEFEQGNYGRGEELEFRLHYGFINAGRATIKIEKHYHYINEKPCYIIEVFGKTVGSFDFILRIRDTWQTFIDTSEFIPQKSWRNIEEGKYRLKEEVVYDYNTSKAKVYRKQPDHDIEEKEYKIPTNVQDMVSGFFMLRRINYKKLSIGDTITIKAFFDKENYNFKVRYMGKGNVHIDAGKFKALKLVPIMPKNNLFKGEESIKVWISDDKNKIPLMAEVEMFVGAVKLELTTYRGLRNEVTVKE